MIDRRQPAALMAATRWLRVLTSAVLGVYALFFVHFFDRSGPGDSDQFLVGLQYWNHELFGLAKQWTPVMCSGLLVECPATRLRDPVEVIFRDAVSDVAAQVSILAWQAWACIVAGVLLVQWRVTTGRRHAVRI